MEGEGEKVERANKEKISNCYSPGYPRVKCSLADSHSDSRTKKRTYIHIHIKITFSPRMENYASVAHVSR